MPFLPKNYPEYLEEEILRNPYPICCEFSEWFGIEDAKKHLHEWMKAVYRNNAWNYGPPGDLLFFYENLVTLLECAWCINQQDNNAERLGNISQAAAGDTFDIMDPAHFCRNAETAAMFSMFPRNLSRKELINPYLVFIKLFKYMALSEWKDRLHSLLHGALSLNKVEEMGIDFDLIKMNRYLNKLMEATHLIGLREFIRRSGEFEEKVSLKAR